jgi:hypothetical protein
MPETLEDVVALLKKHWPIPVGVLVAIIVYSISSWFWTAAVALAAALFVNKLIKKHGGPEAAWSKAKAEAKKRL